MSNSSMNTTTVQTVPIHSSLAQLPPGILFFPGVIGGLIVLLLLSIWAYTRVYVITPNNEAFLRTGGVFIKKKTVILSGGCVVLPGFHELTRVPLREISIDVERTGNLAVRTQDYLRANMRVTFYVCINANEDDVITAAQRLSREGKISPEDIKEAIEKRADDAIRAAAKKKNLAEIDSDKLGFADEVLNLIQQDLRKVGLTLNNIAISEIEESDTYDTNNFFDAQGVRLRTETIQKSIQQKTEVELNTKVAIEEKELNAEKQSLRIAQEQEEAKLAQKLEVEALKAQREREIEEAKATEAATIQRTKILQNKSVEEEEIRKLLALQQSQIEADITLEERNKALKVAQTLQKQEAELAEINRQKTLEEEKVQQQLAVQAKKIQADIELEERNKTLKVAQILQKQEAEVAEVTRQKTVDAALLNSQVELAEAERESKIAQQDAAIAIAEKERDRFNSEAERAQAEAAVATATEVEEAERQQRLSIIAAEQEAEQRRIGEQNVIEIDVFRRSRQAEAARQAAELEAESIRTLAEANRDKALAEAEGKRSLIEAENSISDAQLTAKIITTIWPELAHQLPEIAKALAPQPGILGDTRIYSFPGVNGNNGNGVSSVGDINKLLLSTSGLSMINGLLEEGKLGELISQIRQMMTHNSSTITSNTITPKEKKTPTTDIIPSRAAATSNLTEKNHLTRNS
ncbi:SPFH domain-containing protein [Moorena sp. SIO4A5]|uniref:SPFH domain-containing protein n=1 Tax=Moorena sp. SIO4A5 TaxID=2607838 RepID=UPI0025FA5C80|nr:SPFH domain-containing protein [Moorena sp. SIO4A5]